MANAQSHNMDLIIIGSRGPDPHVEMFLGNVANHVVNKSKVLLRGQNKMYLI